MEINKLIYSKFKNKFTSIMIFLATNYTLFTFLKLSIIYLNLLKETIHILKIQRFVVCQYLPLQFPVHHHVSKILEDSLSIPLQQGYLYI